MPYVPSTSFQMKELIDCANLPFRANYSSHRKQKKRKDFKYSMISQFILQLKDIVITSGFRYVISKQLEFAKQSFCISSTK